MEATLPREKVRTWSNNMSNRVLIRRGFEELPRAMILDMTPNFRTLPQTSLSSTGPHVMWDVHITAYFSIRGIQLDGKSSPRWASSQHIGEVHMRRK